MKLKLIALVIGAQALSTAAFAMRTFECTSNDPTDGGNTFEIQISDSKHGTATWFGPNGNGVVASGDVTLQSGLRGKPGYLFYSGGDDGGTIGFALPKEIVDGATIENFTAFFYEHETDGGPDVPLKYSVTCHENI